jgi:hypothetical protein
MRYLAIVSVLFLIEAFLLAAESVYEAIRFVSGQVALARGDRRRYIAIRSRG